LFWWDWWEPVNAQQGHEPKAVRRFYLEVAELRELLPTVVELAGERLDLLMHNLVRSYVAALCECLAALLADVWSFTGVAALMCLH
jgi:hypothetical protein